MPSAEKVTHGLLGTVIHPMELLRLEEEASQKMTAEERVQWVLKWVERAKRGEV